MHFLKEIDGNTNGRKSAQNYVLYDTFIWAKNTLGIYHSINLASRIFSLLAIRIEWLLIAYFCAQMCVSWDANDTHMKRYPVIVFSNRTSQCARFLRFRCLFSCIFLGFTFTHHIWVCQQRNVQLMACHQLGYEFCANILWSYNGSFLRTHFSIFTSIPVNEWV